MKRLIIFTLFLFAFNANAQIGFSFSTTNGHASNAFANYRNLPDTYSAWDAMLHWDTTDEETGLRLYYDADFNFFQTYNERNYQNHAFGSRFYYYFGNNNQHKLDGGIEFQQRLHSETYTWYERSDFNAFVNSKWILQPQLYGYFGFNLRVRQYAELDPFSYTQSTFYFRLSRFFNTGTTLIGEVDYLHKYYDESASTSPIETLPELVTLGNGQSNQWVGLVRLAQAVSPKTGVSTQFLYRHNLSNTTRYLGTTDGYYYSDEEFFNDIFGYNELEYKVKLSQKLPANFSLMAGMAYSLRDYQQRPALDLEGNPLPGEPLRDDTRGIYWLSLGKTFKLKSTPLKVSLDISWLNNDSNDPYYNYKSRFMSLELGTSF